MAQVKSKIKGEYTYPSEYSEVPDGALKSAKNCNIDRDSIAEPRRGLNTYKSISASAADRAKQLLSYKTELLAHYGSSLGRDTADPFAALVGTFASPSHNDSYVPKVKFIEANSNFYFTSNTGIQKQDALGGTIASAGAPRGLDVGLTLTGSTGFMSDNTQVAYRILWGKKDANQNLILGAPSQRTVIINSAGGARDVIFNSSIPQEVTTAWFYQVYRSGLSQDENTDPNDELGLVYESNPTASDITNKFIQFTDSTADDLRGASLYTNSSQEGIQQANDTPPSAKDIALFQNCVFLANTIQKQRLTVTLLASQTSGGINWRQTTGTTSSGSAIVTAIASTTGVIAGQLVLGIGIPASTTVLSVDSATQVTLSANATASNVGTTLEFYDRVTLAGTTYDAYALERSTATVTMTIASPCVVTMTAHGLQNGSIVKFSTTGALPTGLVAGTTYFVKSVTTDTFQVAATYAGTSIITTGTQSGVHTAIANDQRFKSFSTGTPSQNIEYTAQSLAKVINRSTANTLIYAYYFSQVDELPGKIFLESRSLGASAFQAIATSHGTAWNPALPTSGTTVQSDAEAKKNRLHVSKVQRPEAFPLTQYFDVGAAEKSFLRAIPLKESLILMKEDGFFRLTGTTPSNFAVTPLDLTTILQAPETAVALNNQIHAVTNQGVSTVTDSGVGVISRPIEDQILPLLGYSNFDTTAFAVAYETERKYLLWVPTSSSDTFPSKVHVYNTFTSAWSHWDKPATCAIVNPTDNKLYIGSPSTNKILQERKSLDYSDFADEDVAVTITIVDGTSITLSSVDGISVTDVLTQTDAVFSEVTAVDIPTNTITLDVASTFVTGAAVIKTAYECRVEFTAQYCGNPGIMKHIREVHPLLKIGEFRTAQLIFSSDLVFNEDEVDLNGFPSYLWGYFPWGEVPWGGYSGPVKDRAWPPSDYQRCTWMNTTFYHKGAYGNFALAGMEYTFEPLTERTQN